MNFYKRFLGDYMRDTTHLSLTEHGAYTVLLDTMYATGKPLPSDLEALCRICRAATPLERRAVESVANQFFPINSDGLRHNGRADREKQAHAEQVGINRILGKQGGRPTASDSVSEPKTDSVSGSGRKNKASHSQSQKKQQQGAFAPPDWIPADAWTAYAEMRRSIKRPLTWWAAKLAVQTLDKLRQEGHAPDAVLNQSIFNSWQGLFPLRNKAASGGGFPL